MKFTKITSDIQRTLQELLKNYQPIQQIIDTVAQAGGTVLLVGGAVRDLLLHIPVKDLDIEVHGLALEQLETVLKQFGPVSLVGKSFGVLRLHGLDADWSVPRSDSAGRKPTVTFDPNLDLQGAFIRRDLTINALGINLQTFELIDPFNGAHDLHNKLLSAPDKDFFAQDPLRLFRVMQFIGRFAMQPDAQLNTICASMDISTISTERIEIEFEKLLLKSARPSLGIKWLREIARLQEIMPELYRTIGIEQNVEYHPEGDVFEHTMQAIDAAARLHYENDQEKLLVMYAVLCHDLGKITASFIKHGKIVSHGHAQEGVPLAKQLLKRITRNVDLVTGVVLLVYHHMDPLGFVQNKAGASAYKRLARKLAPHVTLRILSKVNTADQQGRNGTSHEPLTTISDITREFIANAQKAGVLEGIEQPILHGRDLLDVIAPGAELGELVKHAYEIQLDQGIRDKEELKRLVLSKKK